MSFLFVAPLFASDKNHGNEDYRKQVLKIADQQWVLIRKVAGQKTNTEEYIKEEVAVVMQGMLHTLERTDYIMKPLDETVMKSLDKLDITIMNRFDELSDSYLAKEKVQKDKPTPACLKQASKLKVKSEKLDPIAIKEQEITVQLRPKELDLRHVCIVS